MQDRPIVISLYNPPRSETARPARHETTVAELVSNLCEAPEEALTKGDAPAWSPIAYSGDRRVAAEATGVDALVYDLDEPERVDWEATGAVLSERGWIYACHHTWSGEGRARLVLPLASTCPPGAYAALWERVRDELKLVTDEACRDLARLYYAPSRPQGSPPREVGESGGSVLLEIPESLLTHARVPTPPAPKREIVPRECAPKNFDLGDFRRHVAERINPKYRAQALELVDGVMRIPRGERESTLHGLLSALACLPDAAPPEVIEALLEPVLWARDGSNERDVRFWLGKSLSSYERGMSFREMQEEGSRKVAEFFRDESWKGELTTVKDKFSNENATRPTLSNLERILENDENFKGRVRFNELKRRMEVDVPGIGDIETLGTGLNIWLARSGYRMEMDPAKCGQGALHVAMRHRFDPVSEYLAQLPEWDGVERCKHLLTRYANAEGNPQYIQMVGEKFLISAIARARKPGCQVDSALVLTGPQGGGKTSFVRVLGGEFSVETKVDLKNKDAVMIATSNWLVELSEMASMRGADVESIRSFISNREDQIRLPYAASVGEFPRRCVFIATTNSATPLVDREGNRRWWVVSVGKVDLEGLKRDRDQLWAEALYKYEAGAKWHLDDEEYALAMNEVSVFLQEDATEDAIRGYLTTSLDGKKEWMTSAQIAEKALFVPTISVTPQLTATVTRVCKGLKLPKVRHPETKVMGWDLRRLTAKGD